MTGHGRLTAPLFQPHPAPPPAKASQLQLTRCHPQQARELIKLWHSRLPNTQTGPWIAAYIAEHDHTAFAAALWHNCSARTLPADWLELRRLAVAPDAPHCTASWMIAAMAKAIKNDYPDCTRLISYQDMNVHTGTIYKAAGWTPTRQQRARQRDRTTTRPGGRLYRTDTNGAAPSAAPKQRWEKQL